MDGFVRQLPLFGRVNAAVDPRLRFQTGHHAFEPTQAPHPRLRQLGRPDHLREMTLQRGLRFTQTALVFAKRGLLLAGRSRDPWHRVPHPPVLALLGHAVEEREKLVVILLADRVELVVVAPRALHRQPKPRRAHRSHPVGHVFDAILLLDDPALAVDDVIAPEAGGDPLLQRRLRQQVARKLFGDEAIVGLVVVESLDHPVAPAPHLAAGVVVEAVRVGVARDVHPVDGQALAEMRRRQQPVRRRLVSGLAPPRHVFEKIIHLLQSRRQARQVEARPAEPDLRCGLDRRLASLLLQPGQDEGVQRLAHPRGISYFRHRRILRRHERPVLLVLRTLRDPSLHRLDLRRRQPLVRFRRRHQFVFMRTEHAQHDLAFLRLPRHDRGVSAQIRVGRTRLVQPQVRLARLRILAVTVEAVLGEDRPDVAVEVEPFFGRADYGSGQQGGDRRKSANRYG